MFKGDISQSTKCGKLIVLILLPVLLNAFMLQASFAGAFQVLEQSASTLGDYHAGGAADLSDVSTEFYNPAILAVIHHDQISLGNSFIPSQTNFRGIIVSPFAAANVRNGILSQTENMVPNFHYVHPFNHNWAFGFGIASPFGLMTKFSSALPVGVTQAATLSKLISVNINPSIAYLLANHLAFGIGVDLIYTLADYNSIIPGGGPLPPGIYRFSNFFNGAGEGWNAGLLLLIDPHTRIGLSYRSRVVAALSGKSRLTNFPTTIATTRFNFPALIIVSAYHDFTSRLSMMASAYYTKWNVFDTITIFNTAIKPLSDLVVPENYRNSWTYVFGIHFWLTPKKYMLKLGTAYDESPVRDQYRDIRLPDAERYYLAAGLFIQATKRLGLDVGYAHVFFLRGRVDNRKMVSGSGGAVPLELGISNTSADIMAFQVTYSFD